jgi:hypothetical protein
LGEPLYPNDKHLSGSGNAELDVAMSRTYRGMAGLAIGPRCCGECRHYGYDREYFDQFGKLIVTKRRPHACGLFYRLMGWHGPNFPGATLACRPFQQCTMPATSSRRAE